MQSRICGQSVRNVFVQWTQEVETCAMSHVSLEKIQKTVNNNGIILVVLINLHYGLCVIYIV